MDTDPNTLDPSTAAHLADKGVGYPELATIEFRAFHNGLRILLNMDIVELIQVGALFDGRETDRFIKDPFRFFIVATDAKKAAIWRALQKRQPANLRAEPSGPAIEWVGDGVELQVAKTLAAASPPDDGLRTAVRRQNAPHAEQQDRAARKLADLDQGLGR